ncbi:MAG: hypothetical protein NZM25_07215 [Leptospiraceae bacterium]|nr:hypothetical protein [Leptospiraceae bacterium]MDW8307108.1 hypothetical protein [Leptospiraceae bacterium]
MQKVVNEHTKDSSKILMKKYFTCFLPFVLVACLRQAELTNPLEKDILRLEQGNYLVKVKVQGMLTGNSLGLQLNGAEIITIGGDGEYSFGTLLKEGSLYQITVSSPSHRQECTPNPANGSISKTDVFIEVQCVTVLFLVGGQITSSGPQFHVTISINLMETITLTTGSSFWFQNTLLPNGASYHITVVSQPPNGLCTVNNGSGTIANSDINNVVVHCIPWGYELVSQNPPNFSFIGKNDPIVLRINRSFDPANCLVIHMSGSMLQTANFSFSTTNLPNDTLTISPALPWNTGSYKSLLISQCFAVNNEPYVYSSISLTYHVVTDISRIRYVKPDGNDAYNGQTPATAQQSVSWAYNQLFSLHGSACASDKDCYVILASGTYTIASPLEIKEGISLLGAYNFSNMADMAWDESSRSVLDGSGITSCPSISAANPCATLYTSSAISSPEPVLRGLRVIGPNQSHSTALKFNGKPAKIDQSSFLGGVCSSYLCTTSGLFIQNAATYPNTQISYGSFQGGNCSGNSCISSGMRIDAAMSSLMIGNAILVGGVSHVSNSQVTALYIDSNASGNIKLTAMSLFAGSGYESAALYIKSNAVLTLQILNSEISGGASRAGHHGIFIDNSSGSLTLVAENTIIYGGNLAATHQPTATAYAVRNTNLSADLTISHSLLLGGQAAINGISSGIYLNPSATNLRTFYSHLIPGTGQRQYGIRVDGPSMPSSYDLSYNNFWNTLPAFVSLNNETVYLDQINPTQICNNDNSTCISAPGHRNLAPLFVNPNANPPDFHYGANSPCALTRVNDVPKTGVIFYAVDKDMQPRPGSDSWRSIGPYEYDGSCQP